MSAVALNRKARRSARGRATKVVAAAVATTSAAALTVGLSSPAAAATPVVSAPNIKLAADPITLNVVTTGGLFGLLNALGYNSIPVGDLATVNLNYVKNNGVDIYNAINSVKMAPGGDPTNCLLSANKNGCRFVPVATIGGGASAVRDAMNSLWALALGQPLLPAGNTNYTPLLAGDSVTLGALVNDVLRPNGGLTARFSNATATAPQTGSTVLCPDGSCADTPGQDKTKAINNMIDLTWEYNPQADFPVVFKPLALLNSAMGALPPITELLMQYEQQGAASLADLVATANGVGGSTAPAGSEEATGDLLTAVGTWLFGLSPSPTPALYGTINTGTLPLFEPNAIGTMLVNNVLAKVKAKFIFGNPLADVMTPALSILVNSAYPDVLTPEALKANPDLAKLGYQAYDRTFAQQQITFGSVRPMTRDQQKQANAAAWNAFTTSLKAQAAKPYFGIIEPLLQSGNRTKSAPTAKAPAAAAPAAASGAKRAKAKGKAGNTGRPAASTRS